MVEKIIKIVGKNPNNDLDLMKSLMFKKNIITKQEIETERKNIDKNRLQKQEAFFEKHPFISDEKEKREFKKKKKVINGKKRL